MLIIRPLIDKGGLLPIARSLEKRYGAFQSRLIAALELYDLARKNRENYSIELIEKTIDEAGGFIAEIDTEVIIDRKPLISTSYKIAILAVAVIAISLLNGNLLKQTLGLYANPGADMAKPPDFSLALDPEGGEYFRNRDLEVKAIPEGKTPREIDLYFKFDNGEWAWEPMLKGDEGTEAAFSYTFKKIQRSVDIYAKSGNVETRVAHLDIIDPPRLVDISTRVKYPAYSGLPDAVGAPNDGNIAGLRGSRVDFTAKANKEIVNAYQLFSDSSKVPLNVDGLTLTGGFNLKDNQRYTVVMEDASGHRNPDPIWYDVQALEDYPPSIEVLFPAVDVNLNEEMILPTRTSISDDYGFGKLNLVWWVVSNGDESQPARQQIALGKSNDTERIIEYSWDLKPINPLPGDLIYYYFEISDNDIISGPKWAKSRTYLARLPSLDEILAEVDDSRENQIEELESAMKDQEELQKRLNEISREMMKATEVDWEKQQAAKDILEKQQNLAEKMQDLTKEMQENFERLEENQLIGEEIAEKMQQLQDLLEEVATPELKEAMQKLQEALKEMDPEQMRQALEKFQMSAQQVLENLDRSLSLLKQLAIEQKLDMLTKLAEKIAEDQKEINEKTNSAKDSSELANNAGMCENNSNQFESLKEQFEELQKMDSETGMLPEKENTEAAEQISNPEIPENFSSMCNSMKQGESGSCKKKGAELQEQTQSVYAALKKLQESMQNQMKQEIAEKLQKAAGQLLYLSGRQENLIDSTSAYQKTQEQVSSFAGHQDQIGSAANRVAETISEIARETIFVDARIMRLLGDLLQNLDQSSRSLEGRQAQQALQSETIAMGDMNMLVVLLLKAKENSSSSCSGSGMAEMMQKMGEMSKKQSMLNQQTQNMMPMPGMNMNMQQQQSLSQLAAEQEALRRQMEELGEQYGERGSMLGRLDALAEEMKKVVDDMKNSRVNRQTIERQEQILSRMLDAQKSVNRREYSKKRKSEQGEDIVRRSPVLPADASQRDGWLSGIVERALRENYPRKYDKLIKAYFKSLQSEGAELER